VYGSTDWALGVFAMALGRLDDADRHFAASAEVLTRLRAPLFLALTQAGWARTLLARGRGDDVARARLMLEQTQQIAVQLGADSVLRLVAAARASATALRG
jgi:hypothetical protein